MQFQSTLPRRERRSVQKLIGVLVDFNPRSREGSDGIPDGLCPAWMLFQSTLPRRERQFARAVYVYILRISIHAPAKGATIPYIL